MLVVPKAKAVANMFPEAQLVTLKGNDYHLVPHHPAEAWLLRSMGYTVPAPILTHYDWPGDRKPFDAQRQTSGLLTMNKRAYVLNSMGTGKTKAALWAWDYLNTRGLAKKMLVIAPLSTLKFTWLREIFATLPHRKAVVLHHSSKLKRIERLNDPEQDIYILNHDGAKLLHDDIMKLVKDGVIDTITIDELAVYRNSKSIRTKQMKALASGMEWVWGMTGSPMPRSPTDVWAQCQIVTPNTVPRYFSHFRDMVMAKLNEFKYVPKANAVEVAYSVMQPAVRFTIDDVQELPELAIQTRDVELGQTKPRCTRRWLRHVMRLSARARLRQRMLARS
jgi:SNF2 family DNA or RNA helicase